MSVSLLDVKELSRMSTPRPRRRRNRPGCLDTAHRNPDLSCPYCTPGVDPIVAAANRQHARIVAEDTDGFGWTA
jgi:hypothetical protein